MVMKGRVSVSINGQNYPMACEAGEEDHIRNLATRIDDVAQQILASGATINESRLLVMVGLILADRLHEAEGESGGEAEATNSTESPPPAATPAPPAHDNQDNEALSASIEALAERLEHLASRLDSR